MATHSSILASRIPWMERLGGLQSAGRSWIRLSDFTFTFTLMRTAGFICMCFNSVICVVIFDGHSALSGHHVV